MSAFYFQDLIYWSVIIHCCKVTMNVTTWGILNISVEGNTHHIWCSREWTWTFPNDYPHCFKYYHLYSLDHSTSDGIGAFNKSRVGYLCGLPKGHFVPPNFQHCSAIRTIYGHPLLFLASHRHIAWSWTGMNFHSFTVQYWSIIQP